MEKETHRSDRPLYIRARWGRVRRMLWLRRRDNGRRRSCGRSQLRLCSTVVSESDTKEDGETENADEEKRGEEGKEDRANALQNFFLSIQGSVPFEASIKCVLWNARTLLRTAKSVIWRASLNSTWRWLIDSDLRKNSLTHLSVPPTKRLPITSHHTQPCWILNTKIVTIKAPHLLLDDERLDLGRAEGGIVSTTRIKITRSRFGEAEEMVMEEIDQIKSGFYSIVHTSFYSCRYK